MHHTHLQINCEPIVSSKLNWTRTVGAVYGNPTPLEASNVFSNSIAWKVHIKARNLQLGISQGFPLRAEGGVRGSA